MSIDAALLERATRDLSDMERQRDELLALMREFVAYWTTGRAYGGDVGCGMCGGIPHSTTCFVGRMALMVEGK
jgi:hypothetical protein